MIRKEVLLVFAVIATLLPSAASAQGNRAFFVNPYVGGFVLSDKGLQNLAADGFTLDGEIDPSLLFGARLGVQLTDSWKVEGAFGMSPFTASIEDVEGFEIDGDALLLYGALNYHLPHQGPLGFFLSAGAGAARISFDDTEVFGEPVEGDSFTDFLLNLGGGFGWELTPTLALRGDVKDHLQFCKQIDEESAEDQASLCPEEDKVLHDLEFSAGVSIRLGGR